MIAKPAHKMMAITNDQMWDILVLVEMQGGREEFAMKINEIVEEIEQENTK